RMGSDGQPRSRGSHSLAGNALLHRLGALGYVERIGDLWTIRRISAGSPGSPAGSLAGLSPGHPPGYSPGPPAGLSPGYPPGDLARSLPGDPVGDSAERVRLIRLVELAVEPVETVTHDA